MSHTDDSALATAARALGAWPTMSEARVERITGGLINQTFSIQTTAGRFVMQRLNAVFDPRIHLNIQAVCQRLSAADIVTPQLLPTKVGELWTELDGSAWRLMTHVSGACFDALRSKQQARSAGRLVARFHQALDDLDHEFVAMRGGVHDTTGHLAHLEQAVDAHRSHRLHAQVAPLAEALFAAIEALPPLPKLAPRPCHGDLKVSNVMFAGATEPEREQALCLIDLDTVGPLALAYELGDAWRSWCNPKREDASGPAFDMSLFEAAWGGYRDALGEALDAETRRALLLGVEWITAELATRFAADALVERYFGFDAARYPAAGEHNLARALGQLALHRETRATRAARAAILDLDSPRSGPRKGQ